MTDPGGELNGQFAASRLVNHGLTADLLTAYEPGGQPVVVVALTAQAGADQAWRASFADLIARDVGAHGPNDIAIHASDLHGPRPWAASRFTPGRRGVERLLFSMPGSLPAGVDPTALLGAGPQYAEPDQQYDGQYSASAATGGTEYTLDPADVEPRPDAFSAYQPGQMNYSAPFGGAPVFPAPEPMPPPAASEPPPISAPPQAQSPASAPPFASGPPQASGFASGPPQASGFASGPPHMSIPPLTAANTQAAPPATTSESSPWLAIGLIATVTALIMVATGFAVYIFRDSSDDGGSPPAAQSSPTSEQINTTAPLPTAGETGTPSPGSSQSPLPSTEPKLRTDVQAISVVGPTWKANERGTYTMSFNGWPFAFRSTTTANCLRGSYDPAPDAYAWSCADQDSAGHPMKINVLLRKCPTTCTKAEQQKYDKAWYDEGEKAKRFDGTTTYAEIQKNAKGWYTVDLSHYFAEKSGAKLKWQVGVFIQSAPNSKAIVQKQLNDIRSQTPFHP
jgi:hypothetical protein